MTGVRDALHPSVLCSGILRINLDWLYRLNKYTNTFGKGANGQRAS